MDLSGTGSVIKQCEGGGLEDLIGSRKWTCIGNRKRLIPASSIRERGRRRI